jgi:hypothetical protein
MSGKNLERVPPFELPPPDAAVPDRLISALRIPDLALVRGGWHSWHRIDGEIHSRQRSNSCGQALQTSRIPIQHLEISIRKSKKTIQGSRISFSFAKPAMQRATPLTTWSQRRGIRMSTIDTAMMPWPVLALDVINRCGTASGRSDFRGGIGRMCCPQ